jgi:hypothetical protein
MSDNPLAALAMRESAAKVCKDRSDILVLYPERFACNECASAILALPTTFTDADLLAAAMQLPEVRALVDALNAMLFNALHGNGLEAHYKARDAARAALAPFMKGAS